MASSLFQLLRDYKVVVPIIQRDYAQGRQSSKVRLIRERFLTELHKALRGDRPSLELDFVYGFTRDEEGNKIFVPLDGQQRITTLYLLHWYYAVKENHLNEAVHYLSKFTYQTRHSSNVFCSKLIKFTPDSLATVLSKTIVNQPWFFTGWINDPTIRSMLTMLDAIQEKFNDVDDGWSLLTSNDAKITFHLLPMDKLGLPDDLYIKMNSRGKELTDFEYFKSRFSEFLRPERADEFSYKVDQDWSDLFWNFYKSRSDIDIAKLVDDAFLRFFNYVTDLLIMQYQIRVTNVSDEFEKYQIVYKRDECVSYLFNTLDALFKKYKEKADFFSDVFYVTESAFEVNKVRLFATDKTDLFKKCADGYNSSAFLNPFPIGDQLLLFAFIEHLLYDTNDFKKRIRKLRNLIANSEDTVRNENMPALLKTTLGLMRSGLVDEEHEFNTRQVEEERRKDVLLANNPDLADEMYRLEDHHLLQGCVSVFINDENWFSNASAFQHVFFVKCDYDKVSRALLCFGDYSQQYGKWFRRFGNVNNSTWRELFTPSQRRKDFEKTKAALQALLRTKAEQEVTLEEIIDEYLLSFEEDRNKPKDWIYYFVKYDTFRKWLYFPIEGYYYWPKLDRSKQYECFMMSKTILNGRHWSPFLLALKQMDDRLSIDDYMHPLVLSNGSYLLRITNINCGYKLETTDEASSSLLEELRQNGLLNAENIYLIEQDADGVDKADRIKKGAELINALYNYSA